MRPLLAAVLLLAACATEPERAPLPLPDASLEALAKNARDNPRDVAARNEYFRARELSVAQWLSQADALRAGRQHEAAAELYRRVERHDPGNERAAAGLAAITVDRRHEAVLSEVDKLLKAERYAEAQEALRPVLAENPRHGEARRAQRLIEERTIKAAMPRLRTATPMSLDLRDVPVRSVFDVIGRTAGYNFVFDRDVRPDLRTSVTVRDLRVEDLIQLVLTTNQLEHRVINETTALVYPNTPQKQREYQELVVKVFYVGNADAKQTANMLRLLLKMRDVFVDDKVGMVVIKDTPSMVRLAERLIAAQDLAEPEVMLEVEVLEVGSNRLVELGLRFPDSLAVGVKGAAGAGQLTLQEFRTGGSELVTLSFSDPLFLLLLRQQDGSTRVLANPRIRVKNREKARIHIGDRVPVITTTAAATGGFVSESINYLDVGLKLEVEPQIHLEDEVGIKVGLEVSNIARELRGSASGSLAYQIGTRNAATVLRLRDGETQILAGLISDEDRRSASRVPGLGDLPVLGRLFSQTRENAVKTEIVLLITPRLVRTLARPEVRAIEFSAGTEASGGAGTFGSSAPPPPQQQQQPQPQQQQQPAPAQPPSGQSVSPFPPGSPLNSPGMQPFGGVQQPKQ
jgi:general secretion pathway protein D